MTPVSYPVHWVVRDPQSLGHARYRRVCHTKEKATHGYRKGDQPHSTRRRCVFNRVVKVRHIIIGLFDVLRVVTGRLLCANCWFTGRCSLSIGVSFEGDRRHGGQRLAGLRRTVNLEEVKWVWKDNELVLEVGSSTVIAESINTQFVSRVTTPSTGRAYLTILERGEGGEARGLYSISIHEIMLTAFIPNLGSGVWGRSGCTTVLRTT